MLAFIFDIDGTLVDSNELHVDSWDSAFRRFGKQFPRESAGIPSMPKKKRPAFPAERFCVAQRRRYSTSINSGSPGQITRSVYTKPSTSTATQQLSTKTKYVLPINRK